ncbi:nascent polypeptide-associated complex subunit alpha, muscle-specific form-like [Schistocerca cancellata]|uniref:nascent polypeptide-associated complex subunit alpha, muscle-specific form-like n=1 Tax=Schistocerca cancellata TaxID=274614 RepID=UPI002119A50D|nr:nascent polypeptide-associated complex subunit alpha, muscle-specific form-like [Schistocerca cancellata]
MEKRRRAGPSRQLSLQGCAAGRRPQLLRRQRSEEAAGVSAALSVKLHDSLLFSRQQLAERLRRAWREREARRPNLDIFLAHQPPQAQQQSRASFVARQQRADSPATARNESPSPSPQARILAGEGAAKIGCNPQFSPAVAAEKGGGLFRAQRKGNLTPECPSPLGGSSPLVQARNSRNARLSELQLALVDREVAAGRRTPECQSPLGGGSPCLQFKRLPAKVGDLQLPSSGRNSPRTPDNQSPFSCSPLVPRTPRSVHKIASDLESCSSGRSSPQTLPRKPARPADLPLVADARSSPLFSPIAGSVFCDAFDFLSSSACSSPVTPRNCPLPERPADTSVAAKSPEDHPLTDRYSPANELPTRPASVNLSVDLTSFDVRDPSDFSNRSSVDSDTDTKATVECGTQLSAQASQDLPADSPSGGSRDDVYESGATQKLDVEATATVAEDPNSVKDEKDDAAVHSVASSASAQIPCVTAVVPDKFLAEVSARLTSVAEKQVLDARQKEIAARSLGLCGRPTTAAARRASFRSTGHQARVLDADAAVDADAPPCTPPKTPQVQPQQQPQPLPQPPPPPKPKSQPLPQGQPKPQAQAQASQKPLPVPTPPSQQRPPPKQALARSLSAPSNRAQLQPRPPPAQPPAPTHTAQPPPPPQPRGILVRRPPHHGSSVDVSSKTAEEMAQGTARVRFERSVKSAPARRRLRTAKLRLARPRGDEDSSDEVADGDGDAEKRSQLAPPSAAEPAAREAAADAKKAGGGRRGGARGSVDVVTMVSLLSPEHSDADDSDGPAAAAAFLAATPRGWLEHAAAVATAAAATPAAVDAAPAQSASQADVGASSTASSAGASLQPTRVVCLRKSPKAGMGVTTAGEKVGSCPSNIF